MSARIGRKIAARIAVACFGLFFSGGVIVSRVAHAQSVTCDPRTGRCVIQGPTASATITATATATTTATVDPRVQAELDREAQWRAYFQWRLDVAANAAAQVNSDAVLEGLKAQARNAPDRWQGAPAVRAPQDASVIFPRFDVAFAVACFGAFEGRGGAWQAGTCPNVRYRFGPDWAAALDMSFLAAGYEGRGLGLIGLDPGLAYTFVRGSRDLAASYGYVLGGVDLWLPLSNLALAPNAFVGGHVGLGAIVSDGTWGVGAEIRALGRAGVGGSSDPLPEENRPFRVGFAAPRAHRDHFFSVRVGFAPQKEIRMSSGTMMTTRLTLHTIASRAESRFGNVEIVSRRADRSLHRTTYGKLIPRAWSLARALVGAGIGKGDRVATLMWNHAEHLEAYFGIPLAGAVLHTLNLRLHPDEIALIANDAKDRFIIVDHVLLPLFEKVRAKAKFEKVIVVGAPSGSVSATQEQIDYEAFLHSAPEKAAFPEIAEEDALGACYTSGTTGKPKGVIYTHRSTILHSLVTALPDSLDISRRDTLMPVVPMFHVNAWGLPYVAAMVGAKLVMPGPFLDPASLVELLDVERVTVAAGVPTIWLGIRELLDAEAKNGKKRELVKGLRMVVGGSAAPEQLIRDFDRLGLTLIHAWGMTETSPIGLVSRLPPEVADAGDAEKIGIRAKQGVPPPLVEVSVRNDAGEVPRDARTTGELCVKGPWIAARYADGATPERWTDDGYFRTGDVANVCPRGFVKLVDRMADLIKSGGEWIASQEIENALMAHPAIREAAVVGVAHPKWSERPVAAVVLKPDMTATDEGLRAFLAPKFAKFWLPDAFVRMEMIPRTSAGKFKKTELRDQLRDFSWEK